MGVTMQKEKRSFFSFRIHWGFRFALAFVIGAGLITIILVSLHWQIREDVDIGMLVPTRSYALQVGDKIRRNIMENFATPPLLSVLFRWRTTGQLDTLLTFPPAALFWFTYDSSDSSYTFYKTDSTVAPLSAPAGWDQRLTQAILPVLREKEAGPIYQRIQDATGDYDIGGRVYADEPRVVARVTDLVFFRHRMIPEILEKARRDFPLLDKFTTSVRPGPPPLSRLFILIRDKQDSIITQLGMPGKYAHQAEIESPGFLKSYPFTPIGFNMDVVVVKCPVMGFLTNIRHAVILFIFLWLLVMILWSRAEILLRRMRKSSPSPL